MVPRDAELSIARLSVSDLLVEELVPGDPERVLLYVGLLKGNPDQDTDPIVVAPKGGRYVIKNGRHRFMAHILAGRPTICAVVVHHQEMTT